MAGHSYTATVEWRRGEGDFAKGRYSRAHVWRFDGGVELAASASPNVVPKPFSVEEAVDPEEAFIASLASCHMLTFIDIARRAGFVRSTYCETREWRPVHRRNDATKCGFGRNRTSSTRSASGGTPCR